VINYCLYLKSPRIFYGTIRDFFFFCFSPVYLALLDTIFVKICGTKLSETFVISAFSTECNTRSLCSECGHDYTKLFAWHNL